MRERYRNQFAHILIDEYQDTNRAQQQILRLIAGPDANITAVGDSDQSIYSFRAADPTSMLTFADQYPAATRITLERNYRSTPQILKAANQMISNNQARAPKTLLATHADGPAISVHAIANERTEAKLACQVIASHQNKGGALSDMAILYRVNGQAAALQRALAAARIPYRLAGSTALCERAIIKDTLAYLRLVANPADNDAFQRVVNYPRRNLGPATLTLIRNHAAEQHTPLLAAARATIPQLTASAQRSLTELIGLVDELAAQAQEHDRVAPLLKRLIDRANITDPDTIETDGEIPAGGPLATLTVLATQHDTQPLAQPGLQAFLDNTALAGELIESSPDTPTDRVTLCTLHASKGLEYPVVIITGLEDDLLPLKHSLEQDGPDALQEERRLLYVGITRAQQELHLTYAQQRALYNTTETTRPSRFLAEILPPGDQNTRANNTAGAPGTAPHVPPGSPTEHMPPTDPTHAAAKPTRVAATPLDELLATSERAACDASQPADAADTATEQPFRPGQRVNHPYYGAGVITDANGPQLLVQFDKQKRGSAPYEMHATLARLTPREPPGTCQ